MKLGTASRPELATARLQPRWVEIQAECMAIGAASQSMIGRRAEITTPVSRPARLGPRWIGIA